jgi:hypothetical protein
VHHHHHHGHRHHHSRNQQQSSSEEELRSTSECTSCEDVELETSESVSEKGQTVLSVFIHSLCLFNHLPTTSLLLYLYLQIHLNNLIN